MERSIKAAAKDANVGEATLWRRLKEDAFSQAYRDARRGLVKVTIARLMSDGTAASKALREITEDKTAPASSRVAAARAILEHSIKGVEVIDIEPRLREFGKETEERWEEMSLHNRVERLENLEDYRRRLRGSLPE